MIFGSTIIFEKDAARLVKLDDIDDLDDFTTLGLDVMGTSDFESLATPAGKKWMDGEPLRFEPEEGIAIFKVNAAGLKYILAKARKLKKSQAADLQKLREFVDKHGADYIYELSTF